MNMLGEGLVGSDLGSYLGYALSLDDHKSGESPHSPAARAGRNRRKADLLKTLSGFLGEQGYSEMKG